MLRPHAEVGDHKVVAATLQLLDGGFARRCHLDIVPVARQERDEHPGQAWLIVHHQDPDGEEWRWTLGGGNRRHRGSAHARAASMFERGGSEMVFFIDWNFPYVSDRHSHSIGPNSKCRSHQTLSGI